jgi:hypothetical protein
MRRKWKIVTVWSGWRGGNTRILGVEAIILRVSNDGDRDTF